MCTHIYQCNSFVPCCWANYRSTIIIITVVISTILIIIIILVIINIIVISIILISVGSWDGNKAKAQVRVLRCEC